MRAARDFADIPAAQTAAELNVREHHVDTVSLPKHLDGRLSSSGLDDLAL